MWNMNLVQQNFFSTSKYLCMYYTTNAFKSFLVKIRSDCLFWLLTDMCWISDKGRVYPKFGFSGSWNKVYFSQIFAIFDDFSNRSMMSMVKNGILFLKLRKIILNSYSTIFRSLVPQNTISFEYPRPITKYISGMVLDRSFDYNFHLNPPIPKLLCFCRTKTNHN